MQGHSLGVVWSYIHGGQCLENAHDSIVDAKAQTDVLIDARFVPFINHSNSVQLISKMFSKTQQNEWRKEMEPCCLVHAPWVDLTHDNTPLQWEPPPMHWYDGPHGGPCAGPTQYIKWKMCSATDLSAVFLLYYCCRSSAKWQRWQTSMHTRIGYHQDDAKMSMDMRLEGHTMWMCLRGQRVLGIVQRG